MRLSRFNMGLESVTIVTITESNGSCCIIFLFGKKQEMAHYILKQINICNVLPLLHA